jgi:prolyl 4-hydroxylase
MGSSPFLTTSLALNGLMVLAAYLLYSENLELPFLKSQLRTGEQTAPPSHQRPQNISDYVCDQTHHMTTRFLSYDPIVLHIENFLSPFEAAHLSNLANPLYQPSLLREVADESDDSAQPPTHDPSLAGQKENVLLDQKQRTSETAWLPMDDPVTDCVQRRARIFEGNAPPGTISSLAAVKYGRGGQIQPHYDHFQETLQPVDRRTSFFAILEASPDLVGGATWFPFVGNLAWEKQGQQRDREWCRFVDCTKGMSEGMYVKPITGSALFWVNFKKDGSGHEGTAHSGEPVLAGRKVGLNVWSYDQMFEQK